VDSSKKSLRNGLVVGEISKKEKNNHRYGIVNMKLPPKGLGFPERKFHLYDAPSCLPAGTPFTRQRLRGTFRSNGEDILFFDVNLPFK